MKEYRKVEIEQIKPILNEETKKAIRTQKIGKASGSDLVTHELSKTTLPIISPKLTDLFNDILKTKIIPVDWTFP